MLHLVLRLDQMLHHLRLRHLNLGWPSTHGRTAVIANPLQAERRRDRIQVAPANQREDQRNRTRCRGFSRAPSFASRPLSYD
jgi:hypothetical protein